MFELNKEQLASLYMQGKAPVRKSLREMLGERLNEEIPVTSRVRTFNDAIEELGESHEAVKAYRDIEWKLGKEHKDLLAYLKLRIITEALNEGWKPRLNKNESRCFVNFRLLTEEETQTLRENKNCSSSTKDYYISTSGSIIYMEVHRIDSITGAYLSAKLSFKDEILASYAAKQFIDIYADFCLY